VTKQEIIDIVIEALEEKGILAGSHKIQNGQGVQVKMTDGTYFNIGMAEIKKGEGYIVEKLR
jgi:hypothetical protein